MMPIWKIRFFHTFSVTVVDLSVGAGGLSGENLKRHL
jgi:hypothetical protein